MVCSCKVVAASALELYNEKASRDTDKLSGHTSSHIPQRRVILHETLVHEIVKLVQMISADAKIPHRIENKEVSTANKYLLSPTCSRYLLQNGRVPKFLLIDLSNDFAVFNLFDDGYQITILRV